MADGEDWLFPHKEEQQAQLQTDGLIFAQKYLVFFGPTSDSRARELLEHWTRVARRQRVEDTATIGELAAHNRLARFVEGIHEQIELAMKGAQSLPPTPRK